MGKCLSRGDNLLHHVQPDSYLNIVLFPLLVHFIIDALIYSLQFGGGHLSFGSAFWYFTLMGLPKTFVPFFATAIAADSGVAISTNAFPKKFPLFLSVNHIKCEISGRSSHKISSFIFFVHIFPKNSRVIFSGLGAGVIMLQSVWFFSNSGLWRTKFASYCFNSFSSIALHWLFEVIFCFTQRSHRINLSFFIFGSAAKHSRQTSEGTPHVGQRLLLRN